MKRLTIGHVANANIRINKKAYISLFLCILTAVFLATATSLCAWGTLRGYEEQIAKRVGWMDMFILGSEDTTDARLRGSGFFREIGHVTVNATVENSTVCTGYYDSTAARLLNRSLTEGCLPEKAGEVAAEKSALIRLGLEDTRVGETLELTMQPVYGTSEVKTFTLTGILNEQTDYLEVSVESEGMRFPAMLVSPEETFATGGTIVHRVMTYAPLITFNQVVRHTAERLGPAGLGSGWEYGVNRETGRVTNYDSGWDRAANMVSRIQIWAVLGAALMLSACVAITSSMESLMGRKTEDIGMMRAIGATRRQIRRIFGAEAWLLTATALPAGVGAGIAFTWIVSRIAPDQMAFSLNFWLLVPILGLSALCVFVASLFPLYHASRQMPMGVLRDAALLRAGVLRNHKQFRPESLIAERRTRLYPLRQMGAAGMIALTLASTLLLGEVALGMNMADQENPPAYRLYGPGGDQSSGIFTQCIPEDVVGRDELNRLDAIEGVSRTRTVTQILASLVVEKVPEYFRTYSMKDDNGDGKFSTNIVGSLSGIWGESMHWILWSGKDLADARARYGGDWVTDQNVQAADQMEAIRTLYGITGTAVPINVYVADLDEKELQEYITDGSIDMDRLDSGEQALVFAPTIGVTKEKEGYYSNFFLNPGEVREEDWDIIIRNDAFTAGMPLDLLEITGKTTGDQLYYNERWEPYWRTYYLTKDIVRAGTSIGAVLSGPVRLNDSYMYSFSVILTPKGAEALGLKLPNPEYTNVWLSGNPTPEEEERITEQISQIALRGRMSVENRLLLNREYMAKKLRQILLFAALIVLFFAVSVFMQVSGAARQIRSETRMLGTLRAVGADLETLVGCYRLPVWICAAAAIIPSLLVYAVRGIPALRLFTRYHPLIVIPVLIVLAICVALACTAGIRRRLAAVTRQSIVDNIREL